jgi:hypothetical protein
VLERQLEEFEASGGGAVIDECAHGFLLVGWWEGNNKLL